MLTLYPFFFFFSVAGFTEFQERLDGEAGRARPGTSSTRARVFSMKQIIVLLAGAGNQTLKQTFKQGIQVLVMATLKQVEYMASILDGAFRLI